MSEVKLWSWDCKCGGLPIPVTPVTEYQNLKSDYDTLKAKLEEHNKFFREILFTEEGEKIVGVSRNGAIKAYNRNIYVARKLLYGQPYPENI